MPLGLCRLRLCSLLLHRLFLSISEEKYMGDFALNFFAPFLCNLQMHACTVLTWSFRTMDRDKTWYGASVCIDYWQIPNSKFHWPSRKNESVYGSKTQGHEIHWLTILNDLQSCFASDGKGFVPKRFIHHFNELSETIFLFFILFFRYMSRTTVGLLLLDVLYAYIINNNMTEIWLN